MNVQSKVTPAVGASVYAKIAAVQGALARHGIGKNRQNNSPGGNYAFRGIDDVYNALAPLLAEHGLCVLPRILARDLVERKSAKGNPLFYVTVEAEFDFVSSDDGSAHTVRTFGEAMDSSDKATNKAMSAAYKYAAFMAFAIPTEGDNDADASTPEVAANGMPDHVLAELTQLVEATNSNIPALLKAIGSRAATIKDLAPDEAGKAREALQGKLARMAKAETDAKVREAAPADEFDNLDDEILY